ncbi:MAG TPA: hypothetical protein VLB44_10125 [Kofleriaceae bacterium]|nr:hypothetical protein [Kofleriaceae bacterium]
MKLAILVASLLAVTACNPYLYQASAPPPGRTARLDPVEGFWGNIIRYRLAVSEGVAVAITCEHGSTCEKMKVVSDNPAIAEVRMASLSTLEHQTVYGRDQQPTAAFVVVGKAPGATRIRVTASTGSRSVTVTVDAPPPGTASVAAQP